MSSYLIYDKQFIKLPNEQFLPLVYSGSSNCTEMSSSGRERRERSWNECGYVLDGKRTANLQELVAGCEKYRNGVIERNADRDDKYNDKEFGWFSGVGIGSSPSGTTYGQFKGLFTDGCKKAITLEQLIQEHGYITLKTCTYSEDKIIAAGLQPKRLSPTTTDELVAAIQTFTDTYGGFDWYIQMSLSEYTRKCMRKRWTKDNPSKTTRTKKTYSEAYVLKYEGAMFVRLARNGVRYSNYASLDSVGVKRLFTLKAAEALKAKILNKMGTKQIEIIKIQLTEPIFA